MRDGIVSFQWVEVANVYFDAARGPTVTWFDELIAAAGYAPQQVRASYAASSASRRGRPQQPHSQTAAAAEPVGATPVDEVEVDDEPPPPPPPPSG